MSSLTSTLRPEARAGNGAGILGWLDAMPHPRLVCEIGSGRVALVRWGSRRGKLEEYSSEALPAGAVSPSPVDTNLAQPQVVHAVFRRLLTRLSLRGNSIALLLPDPVVRVFILAFDTFPRRADEALPLLRWRLKKSVPFDVDDTSISWMRQTGRNGSLEIVAAVARQRILREYEEVVEAPGLSAGVVLSAGLATLPLLDGPGASLLIRLDGCFLTTAIAGPQTLCMYRTSEAAKDPALLDAKMLLDEVYPAVAYYQDAWHASPDRALLSGFGARAGEFQRTLANELHCTVHAIAAAPAVEGVRDAVRTLLAQDLDPLVGWMLNE